MQELTMSFSESFWGDNGFEVLHQNFKEGIMATKEFDDFLSNLITMNESLATSFKKMANLKSCPTVGSFQPVWIFLKSYSENSSAQYGEIARRLSVLKGRVHKYSEQQKDNLRKMKRKEAPTEKAYKQLREAVISLQDQKKEYHQKSADLNKLRQVESSASVKDLEKAESRVKKAANDYRQSVENFNELRGHFIQKMSETCLRLERLEEAHLTQMIKFVQDLFDIIGDGKIASSKVDTDFIQNIDSLTKEKLLQIFCVSKTTGSEKPDVATFEEPGTTKSLLRTSVSEDNLDGVSPTSVAQPSTSPIGSGGFSILKGFGTKARSRGQSKDQLSNKSDGENEQGSGNTDEKLGGIFPSENWSLGDVAKQSQAVKSDDSSFDSDSSDDSIIKFTEKLRSVKIRDKSEGQPAGNVDLSQFTLGLTLNPTEPIQPKSSPLDRLDLFDPFSSSTGVSEESRKVGSSSDPMDILSLFPSATTSNSTAPRSPLLAGANSSNSMTPPPPPARSSVSRTLPPPPPPPRIGAKLPETIAEVEEKTLVLQPRKSVPNVISSDPSKPIEQNTKDDEMLEENDRFKPRATVAITGQSHIQKKALLVRAPISEKVSEADVEAPADDEKGSEDDKLMPLAFTVTETVDVICHDLSTATLTKVSGRICIVLSYAECDKIAKQQVKLPIRFRIFNVQGNELLHHTDRLCQIGSSIPNTSAYELISESLSTLVKNHLKDEILSKQPLEIDVCKYKHRPGNSSADALAPLSGTFTMGAAFGSEAPPGKAATIKIVVKHLGTCSAVTKNVQVILHLENTLAITSTPTPYSTDKINGIVSWRLPDLDLTSHEYTINADVRFRGVRKQTEEPRVELRFNGSNFAFTNVKLEMVSAGCHRISKVERNFKAGRYKIEHSK